MQFSKVLACALALATQAHGQTRVYTGEEGAPPSLHSASGTFGTLRDGASAWLDVPNSRFVNVPPHVAGAPYLAKTQTVAGGEKINFECGAPTCDAFVFVYECGTCATEQGGLPMHLLGAGWERSRCAPSFLKASGTVHHRMVSYRLTITQGVQQLTLPGDLEYAMFAVREGAIECGSFLNPGACNAPSTKDFCRWGGVCVTEKCMPASTGVGGNTCPVCAADDAM